MKPLFYLLCWVFFCPLLAGDTASDEKDLEREFELGFRGGIGYRGDDRFSDALENYKSFSGTGLLGDTSLTPFHTTRNFEAYARARWSTNSKAGLIAGNSQFPRFRLDEFNTLPEYTKIDFQLYTNYLLLSYHHEWFWKRWIVEGGILLGVNITDLNPNGVIINRFGVTDLNGFMTANGLSYRLEMGVKRKIVESIYWELGLSATMHTAPYFSGSFNDTLGSYYVKSDGSIELLGNSEFRESAALTEVASRRLDMVYSVLQLYVGLAKRFSL